MVKFKYFFSFCLWTIFWFILINKTIGSIVYMDQVYLLFFLIWGFLIGAFGNWFYFFFADLIMFVISLITTSGRDQQHIKWAAWRK